MARERNLSLSKRLITTHDPKTGLAIFENSIDDNAPFFEVPAAHEGTQGPWFATMYTTNTFPVQLQGETDGQDLGKYREHLQSKPGIVINNGTVIRYVDMPPDHMSPMHRTISLDYGVVLEGECMLVLDSGEENLMRRGDVSVQRATMHAWRNPSKTQWTRMLFMIQPCEPVVIAGRQLGEDYGTMKGVRAST